VLDAARAFVSQCPATLALSGHGAWGALTDLAAAAVARPELEPAAAALRFLALVCTLQVRIQKKQ
jgi:hypothetical protein